MAGYNLVISRKSNTSVVTDTMDTQSLPNTEDKQPAPEVPYNTYMQDGLMSQHSTEFLMDEKFIRAYARGVKATHGVDFKWHWRVHVGLWAAYTCREIEGDYVECGVGNGFLTSAILEYLDWNTLNKHFYLFDTFTGLVEEYITAEELKRIDNVESFNNSRRKAGIYNKNYQSVEDNFHEWDNVHLVKGAIPETLNTVYINKVAYLHIDMNCIIPEIAAIEHFYPKLTIGSIILFDDYTYNEHTLQKKAIDEWADKMGVHILSLPTGQGLFVKTKLTS